MKCNSCGEIIKDYKEDDIIIITAEEMIKAVNGNPEEVLCYPCDCYEAGVWYDLSMRNKAKLEKAKEALRYVWDNENHGSCRWCADNRECIRKALKDIKEKK